MSVKFLYGHDKIYVDEPCEWIPGGWLVTQGSNSHIVCTTKREALAVARILRRALREARKVGKR